jgi:MFS family permease
MKGNLRLIIIGFMIQLTTMAFGRFAYTLILPDMMKSLGYTNTRMGILGMGIVLGYLLFCLLSAHVSHFIGEELTIKSAIFTLSIALFSLGYFSFFPIILFSFILLGACAAGCYIPLVALLNTSFSAKGKAFGVVQGGTGVGIMLCGIIIPPLLGLSGTGGYSISWYTLSIINFIIFILSLFFLKPERKKMQRTSYTPDTEGDQGRAILQIMSTNRALRRITLVYFLLGFSYIIYATYFGAYSTLEMGFSKKSTGIMWSLFGINTIYSGIIWGIFIDKYKKYSIALIINTLLTISVLIIIPSRIAALFYVSPFIFGLTFMGFITTIFSLISDEVQKEEMAKIFGATTLIHGTGQIISTPLAGYLKDITHTFKIPLALSVVALFISILLLASLRKRMSL